MRLGPKAAGPLLALGVCCPAPGWAAEYRVDSQAAYREAAKRLRPGDSVVLANGEWRDFEILFTGEGSAESPITLTAETRGEVVVSGQSNLRIAGRHLVVSGLVFRDGFSPTNTVISFRRTRGDLAYHSRVTEVVIDHFNNPERFETDFWVMMYGRHNRFDHNHLEGKSNQGVTMAVRLDSEESRENRHRIDHNYFGPRPVLGSNGGETLRIGTSHHSQSDSFTVVESNVFERCDGELEIISSKSGGNVFRGNLFLESRGTLTLRHGDDNLVEGNVFLGNRVEHSGGIRVINKGQTVRDNYLHGLTGRRFGGALVVMNGVPDSPLNRYQRVEGAIIERNSIIDSDRIELAAGSDEERSAVPANSRFRSNLIHSRRAGARIAVHDDISGIEFLGNLLHGARFSGPRPAGFTEAEVPLARQANGLLYPSDPEHSGAGAPRGLRVPGRADVGAPWYPKPRAAARFDSGETLAVQPGLDTLAAGVARAGAGGVVALAPGDYLVSRTIRLERPVTVRARGAARIEFERAALFEIGDGGSLKLEGVTISGRAAPDVAGNSVIRTSRHSMLGNYALVVLNTRVERLDINHSFNFLAVAKHTFADRIEIRDSSFRDITGHVLALNREDDDLGIYNGEYIAIAGSRFANIGGAVADLYRGGTDESTFGPHFSLADSKVENAGLGKRNRSRASIRLVGVQAVAIRGTRFLRSAPVRIAETAGEPVTRLRDNRYQDTPPPEVAALGAGA